MKRRWIFVKGEAVEVDPDYVPPPRKGPYIQSDSHYRYDCPITGKPIDGRAEHRENLARHGCRVLEKGESRDAAKRVSESFERSTEAIVDRMASDMAKRF